MIHQTRKDRTSVLLSFWIAAKITNKLKRTVLQNGPQEQDIRQHMEPTDHFTEWSEKPQVQLVAVSPATRGKEKTHCMFRIFLLNIHEQK